MTKRYLARVMGRFPAGPPLLVDVPLSWEPRTNHVYADPDQLGQELSSVSGGPAAPQAAAGRAAAAPPPGSQLPAKPSATEFRLVHVSADGLTSVVSCRPLTGRTHQIRVHLQYLGHPIANDRQYGARPRRALGACSEAPLRPGGGGMHGGQGSTGCCPCRCCRWAVWPRAAPQGAAGLAGRKRAGQAAAGEAAGAGQRRSSSSSSSSSSSGSSSSGRGWGRCRRQRAQARQRQRGQPASST